MSFFVNPIVNRLLTECNLGNLFCIHKQLTKYFFGFVQESGYIKGGTTVEIVYVYTLKKQYMRKGSMYSDYFDRR